jgi:hypothetical protein
MNKTVISLAVLYVSSSAVAHAQPDDSERSHASVNVGIATPVGQVGIEGTYVAHRNVEVSVGVGLANVINVGDTGSPDPQAAIMPRFRLPLGPVRLGVGVGVSAGAYTVAASPFDSDAYAAKMTASLWLNSEAGIEYSLRGLVAGAFFGYGKIISHTKATDAHGATLMSVPDDALPYLGLRIGHTF